jgi:hypothetical protein
LYPGTYTLCVTDANGCTVCDSISITALGIEEDLLQLSVVLAPNPMKEWTVLQVVSPGAPNYDLKIYDIFGKEANLNVVRDHHRFMIFRNAQSRGVYFYKIFDGEGRFAAGKLVIE